jgi:hypothetical protein
VTGVTGSGRLGPLVHGAWGRFHRDARIILVTTLVAGAAMSLYWIDFNLYLASLGFEAGYTVSFITIITLYTIATVLYWVWFREIDRRVLRSRAAA